MTSNNGIVSVPSKYSVSVPATAGALVKSRGLTVFARIDFSGDAAKAGLRMPPTQLLIFGNPKSGTPLMVASPASRLICR
jgi:uncharacterized protein (DUF302 family)